MSGLDVTTVVSRPIVPLRLNPDPRAWIDVRVDTSGRERLTPGVPLEWLAGSPFSDYFIPSLILFVIVGGALALAAIVVFAQFRLAPVSALFAGVIVLVWISVQLAIIGYVS